MVLLSFYWTRSPPDLGPAPGGGRACPGGVSVLEGVGFAGLGQHAQAVAAFLAETLLGAVGHVAPADAHAAPAGRAEQQDVGGADGQLHRQLAALGVATVGLD